MDSIRAIHRHFKHKNTNEEISRKSNTTTCCGTYTYILSIFETARRVKSASLVFAQCRVDDILCVAASRHKDLQRVHQQQNAVPTSNNNDQRATYAFLHLYAVDLLKYISHRIADSVDRSLRAVWCTACMILHFITL